MTDRDWLTEVMQEKKRERISVNIALAVIAAVSGWMCIATVVGTVVIMKWLF